MSADEPPTTIDSPQEGADLGASARSDEAKTALGKQVATLDEILNKLSMRSVEQHVKDNFTLDRRNREEAKAAILSLIAQEANKARLDEHNLTKRHYHPDNDPAKFESFLAERTIKLTPQNRSSDHE